MTKPSTTAPEPTFTPAQHACPKCGYCPACGRSNVQPWPYFYPWWGVTYPTSWGTYTVSYNNNAAGGNWNAI